MNWSERFGWREKVHEQYPEVWDLKIVRKRLPYISRYVKDGEAILEIGAFNRSLEKRLKGFHPNIRYKSMDVDPSYSQDYTSFEEIRETFDVALLFEVIEHIELNGAGEMVAKIHRILNPGGRVILSTPNIYTPGQYWKDVSHHTPYHHEELGALFLSQGFEIMEICRLYNAPLIRYVMKVYLLSPLFRFLSIDFTKSILLVARKD